jgi:tetratricopeptide (TPR) repeat protein
LGPSSNGVAFYRAALSLRPSAACVHVNLGIALARKGRPAEAKECFERALALAPKAAAAHYNLAVVLHGDKKLDHALKHAEEARRLEPNYGRALVLLGDLYRRQRRPQEASDACRQALIVLDPSDPARPFAQATLDLVEGKSPTTQPIALNGQEESR